MKPDSVVHRVATRFMQARVVDVSGMRVQGFSLGKEHEVAAGDFLRNLGDHAAKIRRAGLGRALDGLVLHIATDPSASCGGHYDEFRDQLSVFDFSFAAGDGGAFIRESGQRFWQYLSNDLRRSWTKGIASAAHLREATGGTSMRSKEAFAEVFSRYVLGGPSSLSPWTRDFFRGIVQAGGARLARQVLRRYLTHVQSPRKAVTTVDLLNTEITRDNAEEVLQGLIDDVDDLEGAEKLLGLDLRNMASLMKQFPHNDDLHHNGETVMNHVLQVIEAVREVTQDPEQKKLLGIVALLHDLGKAYTYINREGKHTFYDHMKRSVDVAEVLLTKHREKLGDLYKRIIDLTRHHDLFLTLVNSRAKAGEGLKYLKPLLREAVYLDGHIDDLFTFSKADSFHAKGYAEKLKDAEGVIEDLSRYEKQQAAETTEKERQQKVLQEKMPEIRAILEAEAPYAVEVLPDLKKVNALLGREKRYDLIKQIQALAL